MSMRHDNLINGEWVPGSREFEKISPSDISDVVGLYAAADAEDTFAAIKAAKFAGPGWAISDILQRHRILSTTSAELRSRRVEIGTLIAREIGKPLKEAIGETVRAAEIFDFFSGECLRLAGEILPSTRPGITVEITREPVGVVGVITPWNVPLAIPAFKIAPAIAYGNTVVFKPAEISPGCAWILADILHRAGLPAGVLNLVMGEGRVVGEAILDSRDVNAVTFTGSETVGRTIAAKCAAHLRRCQMEMGGKNPLVILDDADLDIAVANAVEGAFFATGQRCTASSRLIVTSGIYGKFIQALKERTEKLVVGHALEPGTDLGPLASEKQLLQNEAYLAIGKSEDADLVWGGGRVKRNTDGYYFQPAIFAECTNDMRISREEIFGPIASVIRVADYDEALDVANDTEYGLSSGICSTSMKHVNHFKRHSQAGMVMVNLPTAGVDFHVPFGGRKLSNYGPREQGRYAAEFFTASKTTYLRS